MVRLYEGLTYIAIAFNTNLRIRLVRFPFFPEHITNWHYLQETAGALDWSMLAPALMTPGKVHASRS